MLRSPFLLELFFLSLQFINQSLQSFVFHFNLYFPLNQGRSKFISHLLWIFFLDLFQGLLWFMFHYFSHFFYLLTIFNLFSLLTGNFSLYFLYFCFHLINSLVKINQHMILASLLLTAFAIIFVKQSLPPYSWCWQLLLLFLLVLVLFIYYIAL